MAYEARASKREVTPCSSRSRPRKSGCPITRFPRALVGDASGRRSLGAGLKPTAGGLLSAVLCAEKVLEPAGGRVQRSGQPGRRPLRGGPISYRHGFGPTTMRNVPAPSNRGAQNRRLVGSPSGLLGTSSHLDHSPFAFRRAFSIAMSARTNSHSTGSRALSGIGAILWRATTARRAHRFFARPSFSRRADCARKPKSRLLIAAPPCRWPQCRRWKTFAGIVNLSVRWAEGRRFFSEVRSGRSACLGDLAPNPERALARSAAAVGSDGFGIGNVEEIRYLIVNR